MMDKTFILKREIFGAIFRVTDKDNVIVTGRLPYPLDEEKRKLKTVGETRAFYRKLKSMGYKEGGNEK